MFEAIGIDAKRNLEEVRSGNSGDLVLPDDVSFCVQCKVGKRPPIYRAVREAVEAAEEGESPEVPVAIIWRDGSGSRSPDDLAVIPLEASLRLVEALRRVRWPAVREAHGVGPVGNLIAPRHLSWTRRMSHDASQAATASSVLLSLHGGGSMPYRVKLSDVAVMTPEELRAEAKALVRAQDEARERGSPSLDARIRRYEVRYEMTSDELRRRIRSGEQRETAEICEWLLLLAAREPRERGPDEGSRGTSGRVSR